MLSYKEYKSLNESLYGAFNLGLKNPATVGGIVSGSPINGTEAAEEAIEEAKKAKKMKKKMDGEIDAEDHDDEEEVVDKVKSSDEDEEDHDDDDDEDEDEEGDEDEDEDDEGDEDSKDDDKSDPDAGKKDFAFMKKKMKKKSKKEWSNFMSDLESMLEGIDDEESLTEVKKGLDMMKKGMEKGVEKGMKKKMDGGCGKKCGKYMSEEDQKWWNSVNSMVNASPDQKSWDGWSEVGEVQQALRDNAEINEVEMVNKVANFAGRAVGGAVDAMDSMTRKIGGIGSSGRAIATNFEDISNQINNLFMKMDDAKMDFQINTANQGNVKSALRGLQGVMSRPNAMATDFLNSLQHVLDQMGFAIELGQTQPKA